MEKKTIWHTPQEKLPSHDSNVVFLIEQDKRVGWYDESDSSFNDYYTGHDYDIDSVASWAYTDDLISASMALDVAIGTLQCYLGPVPNQSWESWKATQTLVKIKEIMKWEE